MKKEKPVPFTQVLKALQDEENPFPARYLYRLSDIEEADLPLLKETWPKLSVSRRQAIMEDIEKFNEEDYLLNYFHVGMVAAGDPDQRVRLMAVITLSEYDEDDVLVPLFSSLAETDPDLSVRAAAAGALGSAVEQGELEELPAALQQQAEESLLRISQGQDGKLVRLRALEALGYSRREEVKPLIKAAYLSQDIDWLAAALVAMGRSYDNDWARDILGALNDSRPLVRQEAATSAGELDLEDARPVLLEMLKDSETGSRQAAVWALSQIGGNDIRDIFEKMLESTPDKDEAEFIESALENLEFTEGFANLDFLEFEEDMEDLFSEDDDLDSDEETEEK